MTGRSGPGRQRGALLVAALFVLVVLAGLAVFIGTLAGVQHDTVSLAREASQARYAARGGAEVAAQDAVRSGACPSAVDVSAPDGYTLEMAGCSATTHTEAGETFTVFELEVRATRGDPDSEQYVARRASTRVRTGDDP